MVSREADRRRAANASRRRAARLSGLPPARRLHEHEHRSPFESLRRSVQKPLEGDFEKADQIRAFYEEYFAIMDLDAEFYLQTIDIIFQKTPFLEANCSLKGSP